MNPIHAMIYEKAEKLRDEIVDIRRNIYMYPELSGKEERTSRLVAGKLSSLGLEVCAGVGGYGVVGILSGGKPGPVIAWRADMDACAIQDTIDKPYRSRVDGAKHACGHDAHTAIALGIAETLSSIKEHLPGTVKFIFQPHEEGAEGAMKMIGDGVLENPAPQAVYGLHQSGWGPGQTYLLAGTLCINYGTVLYGVEYVDIRVKVNRPGINLSAEQLVFICLLNGINRYSVRRRIKDSDGIIEFKVTRRDTEYKSDEFRIKAMFRFARQEYRDEIFQELLRLARGYEEKTGYEVAVRSEKSMPPVYNDEKESEEARILLEKAFGGRILHMLDPCPPHGYDDFALFQNAASGLFFFLGSANTEKGCLGNNHQPDFDIDEDCLSFGVKAMSTFLFDIMEKRAGCSRTREGA